MSVLYFRIVFMKCNTCFVFFSVLADIKLHKDAWPFLYPVSEDTSAGYYEIIKVEKMYFI